PLAERRQVLAPLRGAVLLVAPGPRREAREQRGIRGPRRHGARDERDEASGERAPALALPRRELLARLHDLWPAGAGDGDGLERRRVLGEERELGGGAVRGDQLRVGREVERRRERRGRDPDVAGGAREVLPPRSQLGPGAEHLRPDRRPGGEPRL